MSIRKLRNKVGKKIRELRYKQGLSQEKLAEYVNISREHLSCLERGKYSPNLETLYNISVFFDVDIKDFF